MCADKSPSPAADAASAPVQANNPIQIVPDESTPDDVSAIGESISSSNASASSSILEYRYENGRTYHKYKDGKYMLPNDELENDRLDLQHNLFLLTFDNTLGLAPPCQKDSSVKRVLDVGTGTGIWAIDFGEDHPDAEVLGMDLSHSMPEYVPPNVKFEIDDLEEEWIYSRPFDYIHSRMMNSSISDWKIYLQKAFKHLTPGGYFELQEPDLIPHSDDGTLKPDHALSKCIDLMLEAAVIFGRPWKEIPALVRTMEEVGFVDVKMHVFKWPSNGWPKDPKYKELGLWNNENLCSGFEGLCMAPFTRAHGWTREEVLVLMSEVRREFRDRSIHAYWPIYSLYGRKPTKDESAEK
ncbi:methyltransferase domain-containing protein [Colletotrichum kahawae]|uniref:Methyltransferase domain-containing protein n=1 Tax=Colletotrichum kahawae TaxID=34407 RepID=A0AAE0CY19_COLKA|nr:methyltransferase domain-containing protein [Colletotrichum kahawae]